MEWVAFSQRSRGGLSVVLVWRRDRGGGLRRGRRGELPTSRADARSVPSRRTGKAGKREQVSGGLLLEDGNSATCQEIREILDTHSASLPVQ